MADNERKTYIDIELRAGEVERRLAEVTALMFKYKEQNKELQAQQRKLAKAQLEVEKAMSALTKQFKEGAISEEQYNKEMAGLTSAMNDLDTAIKENATEMARLEGVMQPLRKEFNDLKLDAKALGVAMTDSLDGMRGELRLMIREFDQMDAAAKQSDAGQKLKNDINELTDAIKEQEEATQRFQRNVGNYQSVWEASDTKIGKFIDKLGVLYKILQDPNGAISSFANRVKIGFDTSFGSAQEGATKAQTAMNATAQATRNVGDAAQTSRVHVAGFRTTTQQAGTAAKTTAVEEIAEAAATKAVGAAAKAAASGIGAMTKAALKFIATPIGAVIAAIGAAVLIFVSGLKQLADAFKRSDEGGNALASLLGRLRVVGDVVKNIFNALVKAITPVIEKISKFIGSVLNLIPGVKELAAAEELQVRRTDELEEAQRKKIKQDAKDQKEQARLATIYQDSTKSVKEREKALLQSVEIEKKAAKESMRMAKMALEIELAKQKASGDTSGEAKKRLAELEAAVIQAEAAVEQATANATKKLSSFRKQQADEARKAAEDARKAVKERAAALDKLIEDNRKARIDAIREEYARTLLLARNAYEKERKDLEKALEQQQALIKKYQGKQGSEQYKNAVAQAEQIAAALRQKSENYTSAVLELARQREEELTMMQMSNEELRISLIKDTTKREEKEFELRARRLEMALETEKNTYAAEYTELARLYKEKLLTQEEYQRLSDNLTVQHVERTETITLEAEKLRQERLAKLYERNIKKIADTTKKIEEEYKAAVSDINKLDYKTRLTALEQKQQELKELYDSIAGLDEQQAMEQFGTLEAWKERVKELGDQYKATGKEIEATSKEAAESAQKAMTKATTATAGLLNTMGDYYKQRFDEITKDNEEMTESQKAEALDYAESQYAATMAGIILNQATGIGNAVVAASKSMVETPYPYNLIAFASTLAAGISSVISGIMQARQAASTFEEQKAKIEGMATGGLVQGPGTGTSDSIPARLSNGEAVMTARATAAHYDTLSRWNVEGGGVPFPNAMPAPRYHFARGGIALDYTALSSLMREAVAGVQPVVSVKEITTVANKVRVKENIINQ